MFGVLVLWNIALTVYRATTPRSSDSSIDTVFSFMNDELATSMPPTPVLANSTTIPTTTMAPTPAPTPSRSKIGKVPGGAGTLPLLTGSKCTKARRAAKGEVVYMTVDDGPSAVSREQLLRGLDQLNNRTGDIKPIRVTFYESGYNLCSNIPANITAHKCNPESYQNAQRLLAWTVKSGHALAAHSDTHFVDPDSGRCEYLLMNSRSSVDPALAKCGNSIVSDFVRGATYVEQALTNESNITLWETDAERDMMKKAVNGLWSYVRLPCSNIWRLNGVSSASGFRHESLAEREARYKAADVMFSGKFDCRSESLYGKPWNVIGWDVDWQFGRGKYDAANEVCNTVNHIIKPFEYKYQQGPRKDAVVVLTHDYFFWSDERAAVFRDVLAELQYLGYELDTTDNYWKRR